MFTCTALSDNVLKSPGFQCLSEYSLSLGNRTETEIFKSGIVSYENYDPESLPSHCSLILSFSLGATIPANTKHGPRFEVFINGTFMIKNIQLQDRGHYLCTAQNRFGSDRTVITLAVQTEAPKIRPPKSTDIAVYLGKSVTLDCFALGKPTAHISWILPDRTFVRQVGTVHTHLSPISLLQNGTLQILSPSFSSKGNYKCIASNAAGADTITYHLHVAALPPSISEGTVDTVIIQPGKVQKLKIMQTEITPKLSTLTDTRKCFQCQNKYFKLIKSHIIRQECVCPLLCEG